MTRRLFTTFYRGLWAAVLFATAVPAVALDQEQFYRAYYCETSEGNYAEAIKLYEAVAADGSVPAELRTEAKSRLAACRERLAAEDFARIMPSQCLAYVEFNRPGEQVTRLLGGLDLLRTAENASRKFAVSPTLVRSLLDIRGLAICITGFDPARQEPTGVAVFDPGEVEMVRGMIETALPAGGEAAEAVEGYATYRMPEDVFVTLTSRLVIVSRQRTEIAGVIRRLIGREKNSLLDNKDLAEDLKAREGAMLYFCVNAKPLIPLINMAMAMGASQSREVALAQAALDPASFRSLSGRMGVGRDDLFLDVELRLADGHKNLVFNFLRMPPLDRENLKVVPEGAALIQTLSLNPEGSRYASSGSKEEAQIVTAMDLGREIFGNMIGLTLFVLPPGGGARSAGGVLIPDAGVVISANDPAKSRAIWNQFLGLGSLAAGTGIPQGISQNREGAEVTSYTFPAGVTLHLAELGRNLVIATQPSVIDRAIAAQKGGPSAFSDPAFAAVMKEMDGTTTRATLAHVGRCAEIAKLYGAPVDDPMVSEAIAASQNSILSMHQEHSANHLKASFRLVGIPAIGSLVDRLARERASFSARQTFVSSPISMSNDSGPIADPRAAAEQLQSPFEINNFAWMLLTEEPYQGKYNDLALKLATEANEASGYENWMYVDTLARAYFENGHPAKAVEMQQRAVKLAEGDPRQSEAVEALERFRRALD